MAARLKLSEEEAGRLRLELEQRDRTEYETESRMIFSNQDLSDLD
jgi:hypothetical protein